MSRLERVLRRGGLRGPRGYVTNRERSGRRNISLRFRMLEFLKDLFDFLRQRKKLWLLPIVLVLLVIGGLVVVSQQTVLGSFIYTLF